MYVPLVYALPSTTGCRPDVPGNSQTDTWPKIIEGDNEQKADGQKNLNKKVAKSVKTLSYADIMAGFIRVKNDITACTSHGCTDRDYC